MMLPQSKVLGFVANGFHGIVDGSDVVGLVADKGALAQGQKDVGFGKDVQRDGAVGNIGGRSHLEKR